MPELFNTRIVEIGSRMARGGKRPIKLVMHRIMDSADDYQENGISWKEEYVLKALESAFPTPITVTYLTKGTTAEDTEISGHGLVGETTDADGLTIPNYSDDSEIVGSITGAKITTLNLDGKDTKVLLADGVIFEHRCKGFAAWLKKNVPLGTVMGSVEIVGLPENDNCIIYEDGYKEKGRVPMAYAYSGHSILSSSVEPADDSCHVLEINQTSKEEKNMDESIRAAVEELKTEFKAVFDKNEALTAEVNELRAACNEKDAKVVEVNATVEQLNAAKAAVEADLEKKQAEIEEAWRKCDELCAERKAIEAELGKMKAEKRIAEMEGAIAQFTDEERAMAAAEIDAFKADPMNVEINTITDVIYREIGKQRKEAKEEQKSVENNEKQEDANIYSEIFANKHHIQENDDVSIF